MYNIFQFYVEIKQKKAKNLKYKKIQVSSFLAINIFFCKYNYKNNV